LESQKRHKRGREDMQVEVASRGAIKQAQRSVSAEVRNPLLGLQAAKGLKSLSPEVRKALRELLMELRAEAHAKAEASWLKRKGPMAVYFRAVAVYAGHIARLLRDEAPVAGEERGV
jgi:hypothetical protein